MEGKVAVLGDEDFVMPFAALGVDTYPVGQTAEQIHESADKVVGDKYALIVVAENIAPAVEEIFAAHRDAPAPCIVVVPFTSEPTGAATSELGKAIKIATGINILQSD
jgi:V/A-type H+-transporting ATPase subunit F